MKVAYLAESIEKDKDGVTRVLYKLNELNSSKGIETLFVTAVPVEQEDFNCYQTKSIPIPGYDGYRFSVSKVKYLTKVVEEFNADLIHIHVPFSLGRAGSMIARNLGIPCISTYHTHFVTYLKYHNAQILEQVLNAHIKAIYNGCDLNLIPSENVKKDLEKIGVENMKVLPHGVDSKVFSHKFYTPELKDQYDGKTIFLYVGRLVWEKNLKQMAKVFNALYSERNDFELLIVGTGPAEEGLKQLIPQAKFLGFKKGIELSKIYASADIFVFPSDTETFGNVTIEAMSSGLPCLVANGGGSGDIVRQNIDGFKFKADSFKEFYDYSNHLLDFPEIRKDFRENAIIRSENFSWDSVHSTMIDYYKQEIEDKKIRTNRLINTYNPKKFYFFKSIRNKNRISF
ncbi:MAG: glycosyltransferase family 1 protein [Candidatus Kapabacteria bacterium]|nr:glycosyltransferase family 1 protein [Candidatus Kapabacteria bacterium]